MLLSPLYVANEYVLRRPIGAFIRHAEREHWADTIADVFEFGPDNRNLIVPTALFDFGLLPSVGIYFSGDDIFADDNNIRVHAATWGAPWINVTVADRYSIDHEDALQLRFEFKRSEDNLFFGIGPDVTSDTESRYGLERTELAASYRRQLWNESRIDLTAGAHRITFIDGQCCGNPSIATRVADGQIMAPPGYGEMYSAAFGHAEVLLDSRRPRPEPGSGGFLYLHARPSIDMHDAQSWIEYGGVIGAALDLTGHQRTVKLQLGADFVDGISGGPVPFTEYSVLGSQFMPGFVAGWMIGQSTTFAQVGYTWPVWLGLDGQTRFSVGNAFGEHLDGFSLRSLRMSGDFGVTTSATRDQGFEVLFGLGTETFEQGAGITSVRVTFGSRQGF